MPKQQERASRYKRRKDSGQLMLQDRDKRVFNDLFDFRVLDQTHLHLLHFPSADRTQQRLRKLYDHGYIYRIPVNDWMDGGGRKPTLYTLDRKGADILRLEREVNWHYSYKTPSDTYLRHIVPLNSLLVCVRVTCGAGNQEVGNRYELTTLEPEAKLKKSPIKVMSTLTGGQRKTVSFAPDAYFVVQVQQVRDGQSGIAHLPFFVEWDGTTQSSKVIQQKVRNYVAYYESGQYTEDYGFKRFRVLFVTSGKKRMTSLKRWTEALNLAGQRSFWFAVLNDLTPQSIFDQPVWYGAGEKDRQILLPSFG